MTQERISRDLALERIRHHLHQFQPQVLDIALEESLGMICAQDLFAAQPCPAELRSTVDGYALASRDTQSAELDSPLQLPAAGLIRPSTASPEPLAAGRAVRILTGGPLPEGADCVVPEEDITSHGSSLILTRQLSSQQNVRAVGADLKMGTRIVRRGEELYPAVLAALAVSGVMRAKVYQGPRVLALALGNELDALNTVPEPGHMPADNLLLVSGLLKMRSVQNVHAEVCANDLDGIASKLCQEQAQCIITTGGTGPGQRDYIMQAALDAGFSPLFTGLCLTPGKSMFAAVREGTLLFALPGTPWAVFALMHALVLPAMCWLRGRTLPVPSPVLARPSGVLNPAQLGWERLLPCTISALGAELQAQPLLDRSRESRLDMLQAQGLLIVSSKVESGELVPMVPIWETHRGHRPD